MTEQESLINQSSCYCGNAKEGDVIECNQCHRWIHPGCIETGRPSPLAGDIYFDLTCKDCTDNGQEICKRMHLSWMLTVYLALYNLSFTSSGRKGFFRWKEDICQFIERNWTLLFPKRKRTISWCSTVAGTLSVGCPQYFKSGQKDFKEAGWWALLDKVPPAEKLGRLGSEPKKKKTSNKSTNKRTSPVDIAKEESEEPKKVKEENHMFSLITDTVEFNSLLSGVSMETESDQIIARLLKEDQGRSLDDMPFPFMELDEPFELLSEHSENVDSQNILQDEQDVNGSKPTTEEEEEKVQLKESTKEPEKDDENEQEQSDSESVSSALKSDVKQTVKTKQLPEQETMPTDTKNLLLASEADEHEILCRLNACSQAIQDDCAARRLRRKLILRKHKQENGLPIFDLDKVISLSLASTKSYVYRNSDFVPLKDDDYKGQTAVAEEIFRSKNKSSILTRYSRVLDRFLAAPQMLRQQKTSSATFLSRLVGADRQTFLRPITSPYTARVLKPFIRRDFESRPLKLRLLNEILAYKQRKDPKWVPQKPHPIDYCYVQPNHIPAVNAMCREFFWPGIDLSECLQYPDFSCVVLYRSFVIAFAFMVPDVKYNEAYISFILVHPEWRRAGIGTYMLYHLIQTCMGKDVTLHVSATNAAMLMYQKFGFKPEEFILDFYEKYLPETSRECRHAFFLRLRR